MTDIPLWLQENQEYTPVRGKSRFAQGSVRSLMRVMTKFRLNTVLSVRRNTNTSVRLFGLVVMLILTAVCRNYAFVFVMAAVTSVVVASMDSARIRALLKAVFPAAVLSFFILLPSVFIGNPKTAATVIGKVILCMSLVMHFNLSTPFDRITSALKAFFVPDIIIFTLDLAIKYIFILGDVCAAMLAALTVRTIGTDSRQEKTASGILGTVLIKAKRASDDTARAMECRGFDGKYSHRKQRRIGVLDLLYMAMLAGIVVVFVYLEVIL